MAKHTTKDCDENCFGCFPCYLRTGETICDKTCEHAEPEDDDEIEAEIAALVASDIRY